MVSRNRNTPVFVVNGVEHIDGAMTRHRHTMVQVVRINIDKVAGHDAVELLDVEDAILDWIITS